MIAFLVPLSIFLAVGAMGTLLVYRWLSAPSSSIRRALLAGIASPYRVAARRSYTAPELRTIGSRRQVAALAEMGNDWRQADDEPRVIPSPLLSAGVSTNQLVQALATEVDRRIPSRPYARPVRVPDEQTRKVRT